MMHAYRVDFTLPVGEGKLVLNQPNLVAYRFAGEFKVEISVNGKLTSSLN